MTTRQPKLHAALDKHAETPPGDYVTREYAAGDPPPAAPPKEGYIWDRWEGAWCECDEQMRVKYEAKQQEIAEREKS